MTILGRLRVLFFGSGSPASVQALKMILPLASIAGVVVPRYERGIRFWRPSPAWPLISFAHKNGLPLYELDPRRQHRLAQAVTRSDNRPDLICIATFPYIISPDLLRIAEGINVHMSLLPRHRGPDPLFWTYMCDDHRAGVTVHWLDERPDAGPTLLQRDSPLTRGTPVIDLYYELSAIGAELAAEAIRLIAKGRAPRLPQDESKATTEPMRSSGTWRVDVERWPAERVWHVVRGLTVAPGSLLRGIQHGPARGFAIERHARRPGTIEPMQDGWRIFCIDGYVDVDRWRNT
jgi:methionyl-tRNA formyltransferase